MHIHTRNINSAFRELVTGFDVGNRLSSLADLWKVTTPSASRKRDESNGFPVVKTTSRNGNVLMVNEPVTVTYSHPRERVLFNSMRDTNPTSLLYESLWMLAGRNDLAPMVYYTKKFADYSDDGKTLNGAYGYRWRHGGHDCRDDPESFNGVDQLLVLIDHLKADPTSRRAVLEMWNVNDDLLKIGLKTITELRDENNPSYRGTMETTTGASRDVCCNLDVLFSIREQLMSRHPNDPPEKAGWVQPVRYLDMTVTNRSNDLILGMLGANYVTFSVLLEYMAACISVEVGKYSQFSNNLHAYERNWKPEEWLADEEPDLYHYFETQNRDFPMKVVPLVKNPHTFDLECARFVQHNYPNSSDWKPRTWGWEEPFFLNVAQPMMDAWHFYKWKTREGLELAIKRLRDVQADDWRTVCTSWMERRLAKYEE